MTEPKMDLCQALRAYGFGPSANNEAAQVIWERLKAIASGVVSDHHARDDLVQEVLWALHQSKVAAKQFPTEAQAHSYLRVCLENHHKKSLAAAGRDQRAASAAEDSLLHTASQYDSPSPASQRDPLGELRTEAERCFAAQDGIDRVVYARSLEEMIDLSADRTTMEALAEREVAGAEANQRATRNRITKRHSRVRELLVRWLLDRIEGAPTKDEAIRCQELAATVERLCQRKSRH